MITLVLVLVAILTGASSPPPQHGPIPPIPTDHGGEAVTDTFYFVHQILAGQGSITVPVSSLRTLEASGAPEAARGAVPWAKAGLIIKQSTTQGSPYAAIMVTSSHGVRLQWDFSGDLAGLPGPASPTSPRWLRLTRRAEIVSGYDSTDGVRWHAVGSVRLTGLPQIVQAGLFVASPSYVHGDAAAPTVATAIFGQVSVQGDWPQGSWAGEQVGADSATFSGYPPGNSGGYVPSAAGFKVTGAGDIAPAVRQTLGGDGGVVGDLLGGSFVALIAAIVAGTTFVTAEYRRGLIRTTLVASPQRGRLLTAKAVVLGSVTLAAALVGAAIAVPLGERLAHSHGVYIFPMSTFTELRVIVGTALLIAAVAVLALALGALLRRSAAAATVLVTAIVLPYVVVFTNALAPGGLSADVADWLLRLSPTAAFASQQTLTVYHQVASAYTPLNGYYPLAWWAGLAVLAVYAALAMSFAVLALRRRDA